MPKSSGRQGKAKIKNPWIGNFTKTRSRAHYAHLAICLDFPPRRICAQYAPRSVTLKQKPHPETKQNHMKEKKKKQMNQEKNKENT
jgi:hypothetical protein